METLKLTKYMADWWYMTARIGVQARANPDIISCACSDYLMFRWEGRLLKRRGCAGWDPGLTPLFCLIRPVQRLREHGLLLAAHDGRGAGQAGGPHAGPEGG